MTVLYFLNNLRGINYKRKRKYCTSVFCLRSPTPTSGTTRISEGHARGLQTHPHKHCHHRHHQNSPGTWTPKATHTLWEEGSRMGTAGGWGEALAHSGFHPANTHQAHRVGVPSPEQEDPVTDLGPSGQGRAIPIYPPFESQTGRLFHAHLMNRK